jgi:hypothetical protein
LRFIAVEAEKEDIPELEQNSQSQKACGDPKLGSGTEAEILLKAARKEGPMVFTRPAGRRRPVLGNLVLGSLYVPGG